MAEGTGHVVTAAQIVAKLPGSMGGEVYLRRGQLLPASVTKTERERLLERGLVEATDDVYVDPAKADDDAEAAAAAAAAATAAASKQADDKAAARAAADKPAKA